MKTFCEKQRTAYLALAVLLAVAGCATSPTPVYYTLPPVTGHTGGSSSIAAEIGPFELPDYLDRPQMVTAGPGATVQLDEYHRWVEPLDEIFVRSLVAIVGRELGSAAILETGAHGGTGPAYRVRGKVLRFETDSAGLAVLEVQWTIVDRDGEIAKPGSRARYTASAADSGSVDARVAALGEALGQFASEITSVLRGLPRR